jgi:hypothetical protein
MAVQHALEPHCRSRGKHIPRRGPQVRRPEGGGGSTSGASG